MTPEKRERAIAWLNDEIRSLRLAPTINGCDMKPEWAEQLEIMETCLEAVKVCFVDTSKMVPLTTEQLREKRGEWVWIVIKDENEISTWAFVSKNQISTFFGYDKARYSLEANYCFEENGKEFFAYAYPPAHIDQEAWTAEWKRKYKSGTSAGPGYVCSSCDMWNERPSWFCPSCGRAMAPEAWAELEKRLRGVRG